MPGSAVALLPHSRGPSSDRSPLRSEQDPRYGKPRRLPWSGNWNCQIHHVFDDLPFSIAGCIFLDLIFVIKQRQISVHFVMKQALPVCRRRPIEEICYTLCSKLSWSHNRQPEQSTPVNAWGLPAKEGARCCGEIVRGRSSLKLCSTVTNLNYSTTY